MKLALFDLDHTLLPLDSDHTWGVFTTEMGWTDPAVCLASATMSFMPITKPARWTFMTMCALPPAQRVSVVLLKRLRRMHATWTK